MGRFRTVALGWGSSGQSPGSAVWNICANRFLCLPCSIVCPLERFWVMLISLEDVDHVATLARLGLSQVERETMRRQLSSILAYVESLRELDTSDVSPSLILRIENISR